jgi:hypothetical protein
MADSICGGFEVRKGARGALRGPWSLLPEYAAKVTMEPSSLAGLDASS